RLFSTRTNISSLLALISDMFLSFVLTLILTFLLSGIKQDYECAEKSSYHTALLCLYKYFLYTILSYCITSDPRCPAELPDSPPKIFQFCIKQYQASPCETNISMFELFHGNTLLEMK